MWRDVVEVLVDQVQGHGVKVATALVLMAVGWWLGSRRARHEWRKKEFLNRLNVSLNTLTGGKLLIRTILEKSNSEIFLNSLASETVVQAARKTSEQDPLLPLPKDDYWYYLNSILNEIAEKFAAGTLKRDMGLPVSSERYVVCLTCESAGDLRTRKVRAMVIQKKVLQKLPAEPPQFESPQHATRWKTLQQLAAELQRNPHRFLEMEICL